MPITFGAVGDIISVCLLVKDLVDALDKARGSKAEYLSLTRELWILDRVLLEIDLLSRTHGGGATPELEALCETAKKAVDRCKELVSDFLKRIKKYQSSFGEDITSSFMKDAAMKVRWRIGEKDAVEQFRVEIAATSSSLQMLLATASVKLMDINRKEVKNRLNNIQRQNQANLSRQDAILLSVQDRLEDTNRLIASGNAVTSKIADALRLDWLRQLGQELKDFMRRIIAMNIATYHAVISIQSALPSRLERGLIEEPFILEDAIGRIAPVHLQFVTSWDAFNAVLEIRFRNLQGFKKVKEKKYGLQDKATGRDIEPSRPWQRAFLPGQRIEMSFVFDSEQKGDGKSNEVTCPGCYTSSPNATDADVQCTNCMMWFRRITIVQDVDPPPHTPIPTPWRSVSEFGKSGFAGMVSGPVRAGKRRITPEDVEGEDDVREFKRVRVIAKQTRIRQLYFGASKGNLNLKTFSDFSTGAESSVGTSTPRFSNPCKDKQKQATCEDAVNEEEYQETAVDPAEVIKLDLEKARRAGLTSRLPPTTSQAPNPFQKDRPKTSRTTGNLSAKERGEADVMSPAGDEKCVFIDVMDPHDVNLAEVQSVKLRESSRFRNGVPITPDQYSTSLWPPRPVTAHLTPRASYYKTVDAKLVMNIEKPFGTSYVVQLLQDEAVFYGSSVGRWIFDWTCHFSNDDDMLQSAHGFWKMLYILEAWKIQVLRSRFWDPRKAHQEITSKQVLCYSHFLVSFHCLCWKFSDIFVSHIKEAAGISFFDESLEVIMWKYGRAILPRFLNSKLDESSPDYGRLLHRNGSYYISATRESSL